MTGWRLGFGIMPEPLAERVALLLTHSIGCTATFTQHAGIEALTGLQGQVEAVVAEYQRRRDVLVDGLNRIPGVQCRVPQGAFYAFPNVSAFGRTSDWLANYLLEEAGIAVLPAPLLATGARDICGCASPIRRRTSRPRWSGFPPRWPGSARREASTGPR